MQAEKFFDAVSQMIGSQEFDDDSTSTFQFEITKDGQTKKWCIDPANKKIIKGGIDDPTCTFGMSDDDFMKLMTKEAQAAELFMSGRMKLDGDMGEAMKFQSVMEGFDDSEISLSFMRIFIVVFDVIYSVHNNGNDVWNGQRKIEIEIVRIARRILAKNESLNIG